MKAFATYFQNDPERPLAYGGGKHAALVVVHVVAKNLYPPWRVGHCLRPPSKDRLELRHGLVFELFVHSRFQIPIRAYRHLNMAGRCVKTGLSSFTPPDATFSKATFFHEPSP